MSIMNNIERDTRTRPDISYHPKAERRLESVVQVKKIKTTVPPMPERAQGAAFDVDHFRVQREFVLLLISCMDKE